MSCFRKWVKVSFVAFMLLLSSQAWAGPISPISYAMPNGNGQAGGGMFNYWDLSYTGSGSTNVDGAPLSGGLGDLTDGVVPVSNWFAVENSAGTGPYVGWRINPTITFQFAAPVAFETIRVHVDDSNGYGGVSTPLSVGFSTGVAITTIAVADPLGSNPFWLEFDVSNYGLTGSSLSLILNRRNEWVFASEVQFVGVTEQPAIPEPSTMLLLGSGLLGLVGLNRRRKK